MGTTHAKSPGTPKKVSIPLSIHCCTRYLATVISPSRAELVRSGMITIGEQLPASTLLGKETPGLFHSGQQLAMGRALVRNQTAGTRA